MKKKKENIKDCFKYCLTYYLNCLETNTKRRTLIFSNQKKKKQFSNAKSMVSCENGISSTIHTAFLFSSFKAKSSLNGNNTYELTHALLSLLNNRAITPRYIVFDRNKSSMKTGSLRFNDP